MTGDRVQDGVPEAEYAARIATFRDRMRALDVDVAIVDEAEHVTYLTGFTPTASYYQCVVVPAEGDPFILVRAMDEPTVLEQAHSVAYVTFADWVDPLERLAAELRNRGWVAKIGQELDSHYLSVRRCERMRSLLPQAEWRDLAHVLREQRLHKSAYELAMHDRAADIGAQMFRVTVETAAAGQPERAIAAATCSAGLRHGADNAVMTLMVAATRTSSLHGVLGHDVLTDGDLLQVEIMPSFQGYSSRFMRPVAIATGDIHSAEEVTNELFAIQDRQFAAMRPGVMAADVDSIARTGLADAGFTKEYTQTTGYTLGLVGVPRNADHTRNFLPKSDWVIEDGMVFHMFLSSDGITISDTVAVGEEGIRRITRVDRRLFYSGE